MQIRNLISVAGLVLGVALLAPAERALATSITLTDLYTLSLPAGDLYAGPSGDDFLKWNSSTSSLLDVGDIKNWVYQDDGGLYTYVHEVKPGLNNISEFNTGFDVTGFNGVAGWSFSDASAAGGSGTSADFYLEQEADGTIDWATMWSESGSKGWDSGEAIRFFFQSYNPPGTGEYNIIDGGSGVATSYAPVPEPGTLLLLGSGLAGLGILGRRRRVGK